MSKINFLGHQVDALQWTEDNLREVVDFASKAASGTSGRGKADTISIATPHGQRDMHLRDWIIRIESGDIYVVPGCEVCGALSLHWVRDLFCIEKWDTDWDEYKPNGTPHWLCDAHKRESAIVTIREGPPMDWPQEE